MKTAIAMLYLAFVSIVSAQQLTPVTAVSPGLPGWVWAFGALAIAGVIGFVILHRRNPAAAATLEAKTEQGVSAFVGAMHDLIATLERKSVAVAPAAPAAPAAAAEAAPVVAGKNGVAGTFAIAVTGDPKEDIPKINAAYMA